MPRMGSGDATPSVGASSSDDHIGRLRLGRVRNPFTVKVGQIFTGFGVGCGVGIGVGRPIYLGAIPALQQVVVATRGATDIFSGAGRYVNNFLRKSGLKGVEAGIGCGIGFGHGFGVGIAIKPSAIQQIQSLIGQAMEKIVSNSGMQSGMSSIQNIIPASLQSHINGTVASHGPLLSSSKNNLQTRPEVIDNRTVQKDGRNVSLELKNVSVGARGSSESSTATHTEKVISDFLQNPVFRDEGMELGTMAENLQSENSILQMLLKHQQIIDKLVEENRKLHHVLINELKISPGKLKTNPDNWDKPDCSFADCFECRRRKRRTR